MHKLSPNYPDGSPELAESCLAASPLPAMVQAEYLQPFHRDVPEHPPGCSAHPASSGAETQALSGTLWSNCTAASLPPIANSRLSRRTDADTALQSSTLPEADDPFFLWRQFCIQDDDTLRISLKFCPNPSVNGGNCGAIVGQVIPEGWEVSSTSPSIDARDQRKREIKWLFTTVPPGSEQHLEIVLQPLATGETTILSENATFYRYRTPSGQTAQFPCLDLE
ncbi:MAG: hypothetical protein GX902_06550 [Lentisphaerae bacterium]|nr:hypothetical protein [Lentisphaerota bacterium]